MIKRILVILLLICGTLLAEEQTPGPKGKVKYDGKVKISDLLKYISNREQKPIIYNDANIQNEDIFLVTPQPDGITVDHFLGMVDTLLRSRNIAVIRTDTALRVMRMTEVRDSTSIRPPAEVDSIPSTDQVITQIIALKYLDANTVHGLIQAIKSKDGFSAPSMDANSVIITDYAANIKRIYEVIKQIDVESTPYQSEVRILKYAAPAYIQTSINNYITGISQFTKARPGIPPAKPFVSIDERTNTVMVFALEKDMPQLLKLIDMLDSEAAAKDTSVYTYKLVNTAPDEMKGILEATIKAQQEKLSPAARRLQEGIIITIEKSTSSLIIIAPPKIYEDIEKLIKILDVRKMQVSIEAAIGEMSYDKMVEFGVELAAFSQPTVSSSGQPVPGVLGGTTFDMSVIRPDLTKVPKPPTSGGLTIGAWKDTVDSIPFLLQLSQKDSDVKVKAAPSLMVNDNAEATINIGEQVPYDTRTIGPDGTVTGITFGGYLDASIKLKIIPHISDDKYLRLEIEQTVEEFIETSYSDTRPGKVTRSAKTVVTIPDRSTVAIGGMKKEYKTQVVSKVPILGDIPILGFFFSKTKEITREKYLWIFIKPEIIRDFADLHDKTKAEEKKMEYMQNKDKKDEINIGK